MSRTFTVFCRDADDTGTTFITSVGADNIEAAKAAALKECADAWGQNIDSIRVVGVAAGDVEILEWDDMED